jgi:sugar lactone lactonase YvrE
MSRRRVFTLALLALAATTALSASAAAPPSLRLSGPRVAVAETTWRATLRVSPAAAGRPAVVARRARSRVPARVGRIGAGRYRVALFFPAAGRWSLSARVGRRTFRLGAVAVRPAPRRPLELAEPAGIAVAADGALVVAENASDRLVRIDPATGVVRRIAEVPQPYGVAFGAGGVLYVTSGNTLRRIDPGGGTTTLASFAVDTGPVSVAANGDVFVAVADQRVYRLAGGAAPATPYAGSGREGGDGDGGPALAASLSAPHGLAVAADGALLIGDTGNDRVRRVDPATGVISTAAAGVVVPNGVALAPNGGFFVAESRAHRVTRIDAAGGRETVAGTGTSGSSGDGGPATRARLAVPSSLAVDPAGALYVVEFETSRIRRVDPSGTISTLLRPAR